MNKAQPYDVVIVGGGLIGLCSAFHFMGSGRKVGVIMGTHAGRASVAAAGMLTPTCEWSSETPVAFLEFMRQGREYYAEFLAQLCAGSQSADVGYADRPFLLLDLVENDTGLARRFHNLQATGANVAWLTQQEVWRREPQINAEAIRGAILVADDGVVNPRLLHALLLARIAPHADLWDANLCAVEERGDDFALTLDNAMALVCPRVIIAAGAWSCEVAEKFQLDIPVTPVRGQIIQLSGAPGLLQHTLFMPAGACGCLLERAPGVYIAGTSEEYAAPEVANTSSVIAAILTRINQVFLPAGDFVIDDMWSGFRPLMPDELPMIGLSSDPRIIVATGHYRNGVLLAPLTGRLAQALLDGNAPEINLQPYRYQRELPAQYRFASAY